MGFLMYCNQKGCGKDQEPVLDLETDKVYCVECNKEMTNVTTFTKRQMKTLGQIKRDSKKQQAFSVKCGTCNKMTGPKIDAKNVITCESCQAPLKLAKPFEQVIRTHFKAQK